MPKPGEIVSIDLEREVLFGWEPAQNDLLVNALVNAIETGNPEFSPIPVWSTSQGFFIDNKARTPDIKRVDGGHKRALAHYLTGKPILARVVSVGAPPKYKRSPVAIKDITLSDDDGAFRAEQRRDYYYARADDED